MTELLVEKHGHTTVFTLNRPKQMNAITRSMSDELRNGLREFGRDPEQYVAIITGAGEKAFSSGADLKDMASGLDGEDKRLPIVSVPDVAGIGACEKVTIAAVNGLALAGGLEIAISCDIRIASDTAWFGVWEVKRGIVAGVAANVLPRLMPMGAVMDLMLSADRLPADEALRLGLVQRVVSPDVLLETALAKAEMIAGNSQAAVWGTKQVLRFWRDAMMAEQMRYYQAVAHRVLLSGDALEGPRAFAENREPQFRNQWPSMFEKP